MQEGSSVRKERARWATEEHIQAHQSQIEGERAEIKRETIRVKAMSEVKGQTHEAKLTEDHKRRMLKERMHGESQKWLSAINATYSHIEGGLRVLLIDRDKLLMTVGGAIALAAGVYTARRNGTHMGEAQRSALSELVISQETVLVLATNRPGDLDSAVTDRIDEVMEFPLPGEEERLELLKLYLNKYLLDEDGRLSKRGYLLREQRQKIDTDDLPEDVLRGAAKKTEGFSGREIAKLMASVQAAVYGSSNCILDSQLFKEIVEYKVADHLQLPDYKVAEHHQRVNLAVEICLNFLPEGLSKHCKSPL